MLTKTTYDLIAQSLLELEEIILDLELDNDELNSALSEFESNITQIESSASLPALEKSISV